MNKKNKKRLKTTIDIAAIVFTAPIAIGLFFGRPHFWMGFIIGLLVDILCFAICAAYIFYDWLGED